MCEMSPSGDGRPWVPAWRVDSHTAPSCFHASGTCGQEGEEGDSMGSEGSGLASELGAAVEGW